ncbi:MAG TPA: addiction module protein [Ramlibacter sp.]|nr:addiction module protein [Ramlibacter sp.]
MTDPLADLMERAKSLDPQDRIRLVELLLHSLDEEPIAEVEAAWEKEIRRRIEAFERGEVKTYAAEEVFAEARRLAP